MKDGLRMNLGDTGFRDLQHLADFLHGEFLVVVQRNHHFFLVRQVVNGLGDEGFERRPGRAALGSGLHP